MPCPSEVVAVEEVQKQVYPAIQVEGSLLCTSTVGLSFSLTDFCMRVKINSRAATSVTWQVSQVNHTAAVSEVRCGATQLLSEQLVSRDVAGKIVRNWQAIDLV